MDPRASQLISSLRLAPHPEGGWFREVYRAAGTVQPADGRTPRAALTTIYFLLVEGHISRWHAVASDEVWHFYEGSTLELFTADFAFARVTKNLLGPAGEGVAPVHVVPPGEWQAARTTGAYTLVGCTVAPGFDYADFDLIGNRPMARDLLKKRHPDLTRFL